MSLVRVLCRACHRAACRALAVLALVTVLLPSAQALELTELEVLRADDGLFLNYGLQLELGHAVEDALQRGVPIHFVAEAVVFKRRWYWMDRRVSEVTRNWRLAFQPLTRRYRLTIGNLSQNFESLPAALAGIRGATHWKLAEPVLPGTDERYYVEFHFRLDTSQLPGPLQLGLDGHPDWTLQVEQTVPVPEAPSR